MKNKIKRIKREFFLPGLYFLFLYNSPTFADNVLISGRSDYVNPPVIQLPSDSMIRLAQVELLPKRFVPQNNLINDCYYCVDENRQWYQFKDELIRAIRTCRCDYLDTRIETAFQHGAIKAYVLVIGKFDLNRIFTIDSVEVKLLNENVSTHTVLSMKKETILRQTVYPGQMQPDTNPDKYVDDIFKITSGTRGSFTLYGDWKKFLVVLELAGSTFLINNSGIQKTVPEKMFQAGSGSRVSFKLGLYSEKFPCARQKNENKPEIQFYSVRYFLNQCIADIQVKAAEGIAMVMFSSGSFEKIIRFNGEKELNSSIPLTAVFDSSAILTIKVSDRMGNVTVAKHPVFETLSDQKIKRQEAHDLKKKRDGWVEKNAVNKTLDVISKLDGNPLSWIVNKLITRNTIKLYQSQADYVDSTGFDRVHVPIRKRFPSSEIDSMVVTGSQRIYAESVKRNGTKVQCLEGVSSKVRPLFIDLTMSGLYDKGRLRCFWSSGRDSLPVTGTNLFFLCRKAELNKSGVKIHELPYTIEKTTGSIQYSLVYVNSLNQDDTLIYTYVIWLHDRSRETMFRKIPVGIHSMKNSVKNENSSLRFTSIDNCFENADSEIVLLSDETLTTDKNIYRLDVFGYSCRTDSTFGFGSVWVSR